MLISDLQWSLLHYIDLVTSQYWSDHVISCDVLTFAADKWWCCGKQAEAVLSLVADLVQAWMVENHIAVVATMVCSMEYGVFSVEYEIVIIKKVWKIHFL